MIDAHEIAVITGGRDRTPTLAEIERLVEMLRDFGTRVARLGECPSRKNERGEIVGSTDTAVAAYLRARRIVEVEDWPADWRAYGRAAGFMRNRWMVSGRKPGQLLDQPPARRVIAFEGGAGTADCRLAGYEAGIVVHYVQPVSEPRPWNRHHGKAPGVEIYCGKGTPVGNPFKDDVGRGEDRAASAAAVLERYKQWLWPRIQPGGPARAWLEAVPADAYLVCSCWPKHCHAEVIVRAWRWLDKSIQSRPADTDKACAKF